jgi:hypothetical protein
VWQGDVVCFGWRTVCSGLPGFCCNSTCISQFMEVWVVLAAWRSGRICCRYMVFVHSCCQILYEVCMWICGCIQIMLNLLVCR